MASNGTGVNTNYITTGAGSEARVDNVRQPETRFLLGGNGFVVSSYNASHQSHLFIGTNGTVLHWVLEPLNAKLRTGGTGVPRPTVPWFNP